MITGSWSPAGPGFAGLRVRGVVDRCDRVVHRAADIGGRDPVRAHPRPHRHFPADLHRVLGPGGGDGEGLLLDPVMPADPDHHRKVVLGSRDGPVRDGADDSGDAGHGQLHGSHMVTVSTRRRERYSESNACSTTPGGARPAIHPIGGSVATACTLAFTAHGQARPMVVPVTDGRVIGMTTTLPGAADRPALPTDPLPAPALDVVIPVYNEEADLESCVLRLHAYLQASFPYRFRITIADNASIDDTLKIAHRLAEQHPEVVAVHLEQKGRGRALRQVWSASDATVLAYMDVDLSTDLAALLPLVAPLLSGHSELAIGSRLARGSRVVRGPKRELISRCYNLILRGTLAAGFSDAQCGFKAVRGDVAAQLLPLVEDTGWFFDTELLV